MQGVKALARLFALVLAIALVSMPVFADDTPRCSSCTAHLSSRVAVEVAAFAGSQPLARNVATIINLQLWRTLRKREPGSGNLAQNSGVIYWTDNPDLRQSEASGSSVANSSLPVDEQMRVWGTVFPYGDGAIVQVQLFARDYFRFPGTLDGSWSIETGQNVLYLTLPRTVYVFPPIVLDTKFISQYSSPGSLKVCPIKTDACVPTVDDGMTALRQEGDWAFVKTRSGPMGYIHMPQISQNNTFIVDFIGALIAYERHEFGYAYQLFSKAKSDSGASETLKFDATSLMNASVARGHLTGMKVDRSYSDAEAVSAYAVEVDIMSAMESARAAQGAARNQALAAASDLLVRYDAILDPEFLAKGIWAINYFEGKKVNSPVTSHGKTIHYPTE